MHMPVRSLIRATITSLVLALVACAPASAAFQWHRNVQFAAPNGVPLRLDVVRTVQAKPTLRPIVIIVHGGGWWSGTRTDNAGSNLVQQRFASAGFVTASTDYRLSCGNPAAGGTARSAYQAHYNLASPLCGAYVPDQVADIHRAVSFLRSHARWYGGDPNRIALVGISSGGHLSLLAAATAGYGSRVQAVANWSGATFVDDVAKQDPTKRGTIVASLTNAIGCTIFMCHAKWNAADPLRALRTAHWSFATFNASSKYERIVNPKSLAAYDRAVARKRWKHQLRYVTRVCHGTGCAGLPTTAGDGRSLTTTTARFFMQAMPVKWVLTKPATTH
jgi:carboxylesterase type B